MNINSHSVGKDVLSFCSKCKLPLSHTIVSMLDKVAVAKVKCNTCKAVHKYKDPSHSKIKVAPSQKKSSFSAKKSSSHSSHNIWEDAMKNSKVEPRPYAIAEKFLCGEIILHPKFGKGVVDGFLESDKIKVIFQSDEKTLLHNKK